MGIIRWCLLNLLSAFFPVRSENLWNSFPYLKPLNFIPSTERCFQYLHTEKSFCVVMCCPKPQPMEFHPPKSYLERQIALDLDWTEKIRSYENLWNSFPYLNPLNFIPSTERYFQYFSQEKMKKHICKPRKVIPCPHPKCDETFE